MWRDPSTPWLHSIRTSRSRTHSPRPLQASRPGNRTESRPGAVRRIHAPEPAWLARCRSCCGAEVQLIATACIPCAVLIAIGCGVAVGQEKSGYQAQTPAPPSCPSTSRGAVVQTLRMPGRPGFLLLAKNTLWVAIASARPRGRGALVRIDARSGRVGRIFRLPVNPYQVAFGFGSLWVTGETTNRRYQGRLLRIDPSTGRVLRLIRGPQTLVGRKLRPLRTPCGSVARISSRPAIRSGPECGSSTRSTRNETLSSAGCNSLRRRR